MMIEDAPALLCSNCSLTARGAVMCIIVALAAACRVCVNGEAGTSYREGPRKTTPPPPPLDVVGAGGGLPCCRVFGVCLLWNLDTLPFVTNCTCTGTFLRD